VQKKDAHGIGSAITYGKRYSLCAAMGVAPGEIDDDGNAASNSNKPVVIQAPAKAPEEPPANPLTNAEIKELHRLADLCDPEYMAKVYNYLETLKIKGFDNLKSDKYERVIKGMKTNAESYQKGK
jgi:hypothetical protein